MKRTIIALIFSMALPALVFAAVPRGEFAHSESFVSGGPAEYSKASVDTVVLIGPHGSGALHNGQFESPTGYADWQGWTSVDLTADTENSWHISEYHAAELNGNGPGNKALWCGSLEYPACDPGDEDGGYGNNYLEIVDWYGTVADILQPCLVTVDAWVNYDLESGYDFLSLQAEVAENSYSVMFRADGKATNQHLQESFTFQPDQYMENMVHLRLVVETDSAYSDEDCWFSGIGACQIDDIRVQMDNGSVDSFADFEDGTMGDWVHGYQTGVGDFAKLWMNLQDIDPCQSNSSPQVGFIDDGTVVPGTGGTTCITWCYGPGGYILNNSGGLLGLSAHLNNFVLSPVVDISFLGTTGYLLEFDAYSHNDLGPDSPGIFRDWSIRSTASNNPADIELASWENLGFLYYGQGYSRERMNVSGLIEAGAKFVQVSMGVTEIGWAWGWIGEDGTPAPYYDNVRLSAFEVYGPGISATRQNLAQDGFPACGLVDLENPAANSVRFDMAAASEIAGEYLTAAGDSIVADAVVLREGATLAGPPQLNYRLKANPVFDPYRTSGLPATGAVDGWSVYNENGILLPNRFAFDLPDTGFLYPGDVLHYFISATDELQGDYQTSILPADTTGFSIMDNPLAYDRSFTMRALPTIEESGGTLYQGTRVLFWNDAGEKCRAIWQSALLNNGLFVGENCDIYFTVDHWGNVGNGLGQKATLAQLAEYSVILYTSGNDYSDLMCAADAQLISQWLDLGDKNLFATGDNLMSQLSMSSPEGQQLLSDHFGVEAVSYNVQPMINGQTSPVVQVENGNPVFSDDLTWVANGGCPNVSYFDAVELAVGGLRLASFTNPAGNPDYIYSAASLYQNQSTVISLPFAFEYILTNTDDGANSLGMSARSYVLWQVLEFFGETTPWVISNTPDPVMLQAMNHPNPFNPSTTIKFVMPKSGHLSVKVFDVRGNLVKTLLDERQEAGPGQVVWSGTNDHGGEVSSGVYFYEVRTAGEVQVHKMALVK